MQDGSIQCMFRIRAEYRISVCINNPVFIPRSKEQTSIDGRNTANFDALTKMLAIEKCDTVVMNPLFGSGLPYNAKVSLHFSEFMSFSLGTLQCKVSLKSPKGLNI